MAIEKNELAVIKQPELYLPQAEELSEIMTELKGVLTRSMLGTIQIADGERVQNLLLNIESHVSILHWLQCLVYKS